MAPRPATEPGARRGAMPTFEHVTPGLPVSDLRRTVEFYSGVLGFGVDVLWPDSRPTFAILCKDSTSLGFFEPTEHRPGQIGDAQLYSEVTGALALHESLKTRCPIEWGPEVYSYGRREFALRDPDGYLIIFTEPTNEPPSTSEPGDGKAG
jgi:catechol 2,3-dioxygenase-like lactoylglutathione lyase family enzyme